MTAAGLEWCVYTGRWHAAADMSDDHVIPLSLGGSDAFVVRASREGNAQINRELDEPFKAHPFVANMRRIRKMGGRRGKVPVVHWPAKIRGHSTRINFSTKQITAETFRKGHPLGINSSRPVRGERFQASIDFDLDQVMRFGCRLALGAAHFFFRDTFREHGFHEQLRGLMNSPTALRDHEFQIVNNLTGGFWAVSWPKANTFPEPVWDAMCKRSQGHLVFTDHSVQGIRLGISLFDGFFRWFFNLTATPRRFPIGGDFEQGAVIEIDSTGQMKKADLRSHLEIVLTETLGGSAVRP
jgi:hypothetical protein